MWKRVLGGFHRLKRIRYEAVRVRRRTGLPKNNLSVELWPLLEQKLDDTIMILQVDKGSVNSDEQQGVPEEGRGTFGSTNYKKLRRDPMAMALRRTNFLVK